MRGTPRWACMNGWDKGKIGLGCDGERVLYADGAACAGTGTAAGVAEENLTIAIPSWSHRQARPLPRADSLPPGFIACSS